MRPDTLLQVYHVCLSRPSIYGVVEIGNSVTDSNSAIFSSTPSSVQSTTVCSIGNLMSRLADVLVDSGHGYWQLYGVHYQDLLTIKVNHEFIPAS